jgi:Heavy metal binding domain
MKLFSIFLIAAVTLCTINSFGQDTAAAKTKKAKVHSYVCPMHPNMVMNKPGQCSICGAALGLSAKEQMKMEVMGKYTCPMHAAVVSNKPGKCSICQSTLALSGKEKMKQETMKSYSCSMHPDVVSNKPGKCSKCGMGLTATKSSHQH